MISKTLILLIVCTCLIVKAESFDEVLRAASTANEVATINEVIAEDTDENKEEQEEINKLQEGILIVDDSAPLIKIDDIPWKPTDFSNQTEALGWSPTAFTVPVGMERRVNFWKEIWGKYTTKNAVFHDSKYMDIIYSSLEFDEPPSKKELQRHIAKEKERLSKLLLEIHKQQDNPDAMSPEAKQIFEKFKTVEGKDKFKEAAARKRLAWHAGCKDRFLKAMYQSGRYIHQMEDIFRESGLPIELTRLPYVESMFNTHAYSKSRASGYWQFIPGTWHFLKAAIPDLWNKFKMKGSPAVDRRNDPIPASYAAAAYLKYLYEMPGIKSWPFALTAYNQGPGTIRTLRKKLNMTEDIAEIVNNGRARRFKHDGRNYYAQFLAVLELESHAAKNFENLKMAAPINYEPVVLSKPLSFAGLSEFFKQDKDDGAEIARLYNPFLSRAVVNGRYGIPAGEELRLPKGHKERFVASLPSLVAIAPKVIIPEEGVHIVRRGENLSIIAAEWGVSITSILEANQISRRKLIRPGMKLIISLPTGHGKHNKEAQAKFLRKVSS